MTDEIAPSDDNAVRGKSVPAKSNSTPQSEIPTTESMDELASHRFECRSCSYIYEPTEGVKKLGIPAGTAFLDLDQESFRCPVCRARIDAFRDIGPRTKPSGFAENSNYGLGVNNLTPGQKNVLIFGGLAFALACFLSLYSLN